MLFTEFGGGRRNPRLVPRPLPPSSHGSCSDPAAPQKHDCHGIDLGCGMTGVCDTRRRASERKLGVSHEWDGGIAEFFVESSCDTVRGLLPGVAVSAHDTPSNPCAMATNPRVKNFPSCTNWATPLFFSWIAPPHLTRLPQPPPTQKRPLYRSTLKQQSPMANQGSQPDVESPPTTPTKPGDAALPSSPASTFADEPRGTRSSAATAATGPPSPQTVVVDVKTSTGRSGRSAAGLLLSKPMMALGGMLFLGTAGAAAFGWLQIPGLSNQIKELEAEVDRLASEVDRLAKENDRFEELNNELNATVEEFRSINEDLNATVLDLKNITGDLDATNDALVDRVGELASENDEFAALNAQLNATADRLEQEVGFFEVAVGQLILENANLANLTGALDGVANQLGDITDEQSSTLNGIFTVLEGIGSENARLEALNNDLLTVVAFLNDTSAGLGDSLDQISGFLANQIVANEVLVIENLESSYRQKFQCWDCDYLDRFREEPFGRDFTLPIPDLAPVVAYADDRVLSELCLDADDFNEYLLQLYPDGEVSSNRFVSGLGSYVNDALTFYFPNDITAVAESDTSGVSLQAWKEASYNCQNLPVRFDAPLVIRSGSPGGRQ